MPRPHVLVRNVEIFPQPLYVSKGTGSFGRGVGFGFGFGDWALGFRDQDLGCRVPK